jgi:Ni/Co efflux regulator RcnB
MTRLFCAVAAIALLVPTAAVAQRQHDRHDNNNAAAQRQDRQANTRTRTDRQQTRRQSDRTVTNRTRATERNYRSNNRTATERVTRTTTTRNVYRVGHRPATYHRIRARTFSYPRGYSYRRWSIGAVLPRLFLSNSYYWTDWSALGLLPPPPGYAWVRYGPDLLLVNRFTGRIADVIYGAFY